MFAFLSKLRLTSGSTQPPQDDGDDTSSIRRSLNLPWPVTESSARRPPAQTPAPQALRREWPPNHSFSQASGSAISISHPIPRTAPNSLTGIDDFPMPPSGPLTFGDGSNGLPGYARPIRSAAAQGSVVGSQGPAWYEHEKPRSLYPRPQLQAHPSASQSPAQAPYAPPEVVRLDSGVFSPDDGTDDGESENEDDQRTNAQPAPLPRHPYEYTSHPSASSYALPYHPYSGTRDPDSEPQVHQRPTNKSNRNIPEYDDNANESELYSSPFDSDTVDAFPAAPRSTTSTSSSSASNHAPITKSRWNLKLQLHSGTAQSASSPLPTGFGAPRPKSVHLAGDDHFPTPSVQNHGGTGVHDGSPVSVDTDVFHHAYNYPLAKQLSPIVEQDYISPGSDFETRSASLKFSRGDGKPSPGGDSLVGSVLRDGSLHRKDRGNMKEVEDSADRDSVKTRRTGSVGSVGTYNGHGNSLSRTGSLSMGAPAPIGVSQGTSPGGSLEIARPSPIYASPFIQRPLNRTGSQSSSKSDSHLQGQPFVQTPTAQVYAGSAIRSTINTGNKASQAHSRDVPVQTPISAGATTTPTGTMHTPTSALQSPVVHTPITPCVGHHGPVIQPLPVALVTGPTPPMQEPSGLPKIPSLPSIPPLDLRFSMVGPSREIKSGDNSSRAGVTSRKGATNVDRMPVIDGSVEGYYEEEDEDEDYEDEGEDIEDNEVDNEEEDEEYERESLHADSFVTAGTNEDADADPELGLEMATLGKHGSAGQRSSTGSASSRIPSASASDSQSRSSRSPPLTTLDPGGLLGIPITPGSATGESFIHRRWDRDAALGFGARGISSSPITFRAKGQRSRWLGLFSSSPYFASSSSSFTPAFWAFWMGFLFPVLWLVGGWHFTNSGELPPKYTLWEWYFWNSRWTAGGFRALVERVLGCCMRRNLVRKELGKQPGANSQDSATNQTESAQRRQGKRRSTTAQPTSRAGKVYPALPRWVAEKQSTDDGRMRLNDPKRSLRGISFGYPFISRPPSSQDSFGMPNPTASSSSSGLTRVVAVLEKPNRVLDLMYGVKLKEVRGRPESGRRMFDPWIQRCRYALCYGMVLLAIGLCTASAYLIAFNTRKLK